MTSWIAVFVSAFLLLGVDLYQTTESPSVFFRTVHYLNYHHVDTKIDYYDRNQSTDLQTCQFSKCLVKYGSILVSDELLGYPTLMVDKEDRRHNQALISFRNVFVLRHDERIVQL